MNHKKTMFLKTIVAIGLLSAIFLPCLAPDHNILILSNAHSNALGGGITYEVSLYKALVQQGIHVELLIIKNPVAQEFLVENSIPHRSYCWSGLRKALLRVCRNKRITIIHTSTSKELEIAKSIKKIWPIKVVATMHSQRMTHKRKNRLRDIDGIISVNESIAHMLSTMNLNGQSKMSKIEYIPPFFDEARFCNVKARSGSSDFFNNIAGIKINSQWPIITSIAHFYSKSKNHGVLIRAINILIKHYNIPVYLMLAGSGPEKEPMIGLVRRLKLDSYVYFLGSVARENIPELLWHSTIKALTSDKEGAGIVLLEASMLKKPLIGTGGTGMEIVVKDGVTGLLFERGNAQDLAAKLKVLLLNPVYAQELGVGAYHYVKENLSTQVTINKYLAFLSTL